MMSENTLDEFDVGQRRERILAILEKESKVKVNELSQRFSVSEVTVRNDLSELEEAGLLERIHGGAISSHKAYYNMSLKERMRTNEPEKRRIAAKVALMVSGGDTLMMDSGTTTLYIARELKTVKDLTIVTNSLAVAEEIGYRDNIHVILIGGSLDQRYQFTYGDDAVNQMKKYKADLMVVSADGISLEDGITTHHYHEAEVSRQMMARANKTLAAVDHSKVGRGSFAFIGAIDCLDILVTDEKASQEELALFRDKGVKVIIV
jgi:DeoR/GlpR family transcriptional regulator of sugar metabolism